MNITQGFAEITEFAREAGFAVTSWGAGWHYDNQGQRWAGRKFTRGNREILVVGGISNNLVAGGTLRIDGGNATILERNEIAGALLQDWAPVSLVK